MSGCVKVAKRENAEHKVILTQCQFCGEGNYFSDEAYAYLWILGHRCGE